VNTTARQRNPERTRNQILKAAARLIRNRGLARVTTRDIAHEAGCAEGTLYKHFDNKEDLFLAVVLQSLPGFETMLDPALAQQAGVSENLGKIIAAAIEFFEKVLPQGVALLADSALLARHRKRLRAKDMGPHLLYQAAADYISAEQARGRINPTVNPVSAAALILGPCFQWVLTRMINGAAPLRITDKEFSEQLVSTLLLGLSPRP
jgi:AcrR family transcriptional regulator